MALVLDQDTRDRVVRLRKEARRRNLKKDFEGEEGLHAFVQHFWHILEPQTEFVDGWPLHTICEHLQAVSEGRITRLLINVPPGFMKSLLVDVFWPAWEWATFGPHLRYVTFSYSSDLTRRDNRRFGALVGCREYQELFGDKVVLVKQGEEMVSNTATGWKLASSIGGVGTGERGNRVILDDPHNVKEFGIRPRCGARRFVGSEKPCPTVCRIWKKTPLSSSCSGFMARMCRASSSTIEWPMFT